MELHILTRALGAFAVLAAAALYPASADTISEPFNTDTNNVGTTYPDYTLSGPISASVANGQLNAQAQLNGGYVGFTTNASFANVHSVSADIGTATSYYPGNFNVNLFIGTGTPTSPDGFDDRIVFHPGFAGGAFRIEGPGATSNMDMGFTPPTGADTLTHVRVDVLPAGKFKATLSYGADSFSYIWSNPELAASAFRVGVGFIDSTVPDQDTAVFDNLTVTTGAPIGAVAPLPKAFPAGLMLMGCFFAIRVRRNSSLRKLA